MNDDINSLLEIGSSNQPNNIPTGEYHYTKDPSSLTNLIKVLLIISLFVSIVSIISDIMQINLLGTFNYSQSEAEANDARQLIIALISIGVFIITGIFFLIWIYRANSNCCGFTTGNMEFTPGWSVGWYFIPFANLYKPYRVMKEIWNVSDNPDHWQSQSSSPLLVSWWTLWLLSGFFGQLSFRLSMGAHTISALKTATTISILSGLINIPLDIICIVLISAIFAKQEKLVKKIT